MPTNLQNQQGYIALIAVIIIVSVTLAISLTMNILSIDETKTGLLRQQSAQSFALADSCMQEAYLRIKWDNGFSGGSLNTADGSCNITVIALFNRRIVRVEANVNDVIRRLESGLRIQGNNLIILSWRQLN